MTSTRLAYTILKPEKALEILRTLSPSALPPDAKVAKIGYDPETDHLVFVLESATFAEVAHSDLMPEISLETP